MNKCYKFLLLILFFPAIGLGQQNFKAGYVVTLKGDTLKGFINYREWNRNPEKFSFKKTADHTTDETYTLDNALAFGVTGLESYRRYTVSVSNESPSLTDASTFVDTTTHKATVFLKLLISGDKLSLFSYTDNLKTRYYIAEPGATPKELTQGVHSNDNGTYSYNYRYRAQLAYYAQQLNRYPPLTESKIGAARYTDEDLMDVVTVINTHVDQQKSTQTTSGQEFFCGLGVNYSTLKFTGDYATDNYNTNLKNVPYPMLSGGFDIFTNSTTRKFFVRAEVILTAAQQTTFDDITYHQYLIILNPQLGYNFYNTKALKVYATMGVDLNRGSYSTKQNNSTTSASVYYNNLQFQSFWFAPNIHAGVQLNQKLGFFAEFVKTSHASEYTVTNAQITSLRAGVYYYLGKKQ